MRRVRASGAAANSALAKFSQTKSPGTAPGLFNFLFRRVANQAWVAVGFLCSLLWAISMK